MGTNAAQFARELAADTKALNKEFVDWRAKIVTKMLTVAEGRTPISTRPKFIKGKNVGQQKRLKRGWGIEVTRKATFGGNWVSLPSVETRLRKTVPKSPIQAGNREFTASWHENGTKTTTRARHMLAVGIESVKDERA